MDTVEELMAIASSLAKKAGDLKAASAIEEFSLAGQSPTEIRHQLTESNPYFKCTDADLSLQEAERVLNQIQLTRFQLKR